MTDRTKTNVSRALPALSGREIMSLLRTRTIIALFLLLLVFVAGIEVARPGTVNALWASNMVLFAAPLGIVAAGQTLTMALNLYNGGTESYLQVVTAQTDLLQTQEALLGIQTRQLTAQIGLIRALGGGWEEADLPNRSAMTRLAPDTLETASTNNQR